MDVPSNGKQQGVLLVVKAAVGFKEVELELISLVKALDGNKMWSPVPILKGP